MADIWQQFHSLPKAIRDGVATPQAIAAIDDLEQQFSGVDLANIIMRVVVHEFPVSTLPEVLKKEFAIDDASATTIAERLSKDVFVGVIADYLGLNKQVGPTPVPTAPVQVPQSPINVPVTLASVPPQEHWPEKPAPLPDPTTTTRVIEPPVILPVIAPATTSTMPTAPDTVMSAPAISMPTLSAPIGTNAPTTHYSDDDAVEIDQQQAKLKAMTTPNVNQDFDTIAQSILTEQNLAYGDELLQRRAIAIIKARLKGIRETDETKEMLMRDPKIGGLGLDQEIAGTVSTAAEKYAGQLHIRGMVTTPETVAMPMPPPVPKIQQQRPAPMPPLTRESRPVTVPVIPSNITDAPRASRPIVRPTDIPMPQPVPTPPPTKNDAMPSLDSFFQ